MTLMFTVVSWHPVPLVKLVTGPRATTVNIALTVGNVCRFRSVNMINGYFLNSLVSIHKEVIIFYL